MSKSVKILVYLILVWEFRLELQIYLNKIIRTNSSDVDMVTFFV